MYSTLTYTNSKFFYNYTVIHFTTFQEFYSNYFFVYKQRIETEAQKQNQLNIGVIAGITAVVVVIIIVIVLSFYFGRKKNVHKEDVVQDYNYQTNEWNSFTCTSALKEIDEDPFVVDFKEPNFVTPL